VAAKECVFCAIVEGRAPAHVVLDEPGVVAFLDAHPLFKGHLLVVPRAHVVTLPELSAVQVSEVFGAVQRCAAAVVAGIGAQGSFVAQNNVVSQAVPHVHVHVVPRTKGDGLRGFFWPRVKYADDTEMAEYASRLRAQL